MKHVVEVRETGGRFADIFDFLERVDPRAVNKRALEGLAKAGAFDSIHPNRRQLFEQADVLMAYCQSVAADRNSSQESPVRRRSGRGVTASAQDGRPLGRAGEAGSGTVGRRLLPVRPPAGGHGGGAARKRVTFVAEAVQRPRAGHEAFMMAGVVRRRQERASAKSGEKFAFVTFSDPTGEFECLFPPEQLRQSPRGAGGRRRLDGAGAGQVVGRRGAVLRRRGVETGRPVDDASVGLRVHVSARSTDPSAIQARLERAKAQGKGGEVSLIASLDGRREVEVKLPGRYRLDGALRGALKSAPGVLMLEDA